MKYLVQPLVPFSANAPGTNDQRVYAIASEHSRQVLTMRSELVWGRVQGGLRHVSAGVDGTVWGVNGNDNIWRWNGKDWIQVPGKLMQVSVGSADHVWGVSRDHRVWRWNGSALEQAPGGLKNVSVGRDGTVWGVNGGDDIWHWLGNTWEQIPGKLKQISVGSRTLVWGVNSKDEIFVRRGDKWMQIAGGLSHVSVGADGSVWGVNGAHEVWRWRGGGWEKMNGALRQISVGSASDVWGVNAADEIWRNVGNGTGRLIQALWTEDPRQQWRLIALGDGYFRIQNVATNLALDVAGSAVNQGAELIGWPQHGGPNQQFRIEGTHEARFKITTRHSGLVLDVDGNSLETGAKIHQWVSHGGANQVWWLAEVKPSTSLFDPRARLFEHGDYQGASLEVGVGAYNVADLKSVGNDRVSSLKVPAGVRVTLWEHANWSGRSKSFTGDTSYVGSDFNDIASSVTVEKVVTLYEHNNFQGRSSALGVGTHKLGDLGIPNDSLSSLRVPQGLMVTLWEHEAHQGQQLVYFEDAPVMAPGWNDRVSSIVVRHLGVAIPRDAIRFGGKIQLRGHHGKWLVAEGDGNLNANRAEGREWETFTIVRAGPSQHTSHVAFGDTIALRSFHGKYVVAEADGNANANRNAIGDWEKWIVVRSGASDSDLFMAHGDVISLRSSHNKYLVAEGDGNANANRPGIGDWERFTITGYAPSPNEEPAGGPCGAAVCGANVCAVEACGADACGAEACGIDAALVGACGVASAGIAICGVDVAVIGVCGAAATGAGACGAAACGAAACGADACAAAVAGLGACGAAACGAAACGAAACGADACGAAACGAEACGAATCGVDANPIDACGADAGAIDVCPADACGANVCAINACPADACAADACAIDVIPIIPGI